MSNEPQKPEDQEQRQGHALALEEAKPDAAKIPDTSGLTMAPVREGSLEEYRQPVAPAPLPDIDHLKLEEKVQRPSGRAKFEVSED